MGAWDTLQPGEMMSPAGTPEPGALPGIRKAGGWRLVGGCCGPPGVSWGSLRSCPISQVRGCLLTTTGRQRPQSVFMNECERLMSAYESNIRSSCKLWKTEKHTSPRLQRRWGPLTKRPCWYCSFQTVRRGACVSGGLHLCTTAL